MNIRDNLISMLHGNSGIQIFSYKNTKALQVCGVEKAFIELSNNLINPVKTIIEIGTDFGGLTNLLADLEISNHAIIHTFDINPTRFISHNNKIIFHNEDVFSIESKIAELIQSDGTTLLLCDGGNKKEEFKIFHQYLKHGDIIMAHDYAPTVEEFNKNYKNKIWSWHEFEDSFANFDGLEPFMQDLFKQYAWCIRRKI